MKKIFMFVTAMVTLVSCTFSSNLDNEGYAEETRKIEGFNQIQVVGSPTVIYTQGNKYEVRVRVPNSDDPFKQVKTELQGDRLVVSLRSQVNLFGIGGKSTRVVVYVTSPDLIGVEVAGSGDFKSDKPIDTDNISLAVKGSGDLSIDGHLLCDNVKMTVTGSGDLEVKNLEALTNDVTLVGSGDMEVRQSKVGSTRVRLTGSGDIKIDCRECGSVDSNLTGSGDISITGTVRNVNKSKAGSGDYHLDIRR